METSVSTNRPPREKPLPDLIVKCVLYTAAVLFGTVVFVNAVPPTLKGPARWYGVPLLFVIAGLALAKKTAVRRDIHLIGAGLTWRNALVLGGLALLIPAVENILIVLGVRAFLPHLLGQAGGGAESLGQVIRSLVGSPIGEEVLFRGWLLSWLALGTRSEHRILGCTLTTANLLTSLAFAAIHLMNGISMFTPVNLLGIFLIALLLGRAKERTGGLLMPMICHSLVNFVSSVVF